MWFLFVVMIQADGTYASQFSETPMTAWRCERHTRQIEARRDITASAVCIKDVKG